MPLREFLERKLTGVVRGDKHKAALGDLVHALLREVLWTESDKREKATREQGVARTRLNRDGSSCKRTSLV